MSNTPTGRTPSRVVWIALGVGAVVLAAILFATYVWDRNRPHRIYGLNAPVPVLVAKQLIPKGTPGVLIASQPAMYAVTTPPPKEIEDGAISDPSYLRGRATAVDIDPDSS